MKKRLLMIVSVIFFASLFTVRPVAEGSYDTAAVKSRGRIHMVCGGDTQIILDANDLSALKGINDNTKGIKDDTERILAEYLAVSR